MYHWIEKYVPDGHDSPLGMLLDTAYAIEYGADTKKQASLNLIYLLAFQPEWHGLSIFGESDERFHIRGGNQQLPEAIAEWRLVLELDPQNANARKNPEQAERLQKALDERKRK